MGSVLVGGHGCNCHAACSIHIHLINCGFGIPLTLLIGPCIGAVIGPVGEGEIAALGLTDQFDLLCPLQRAAAALSISYATEPSRRAEVNRIAQAYERSVPTPVTRYEVEQIISTYTNKVRNDLRAIKRMLKEGAENG